MADVVDAKTVLNVGGTDYQIYSLQAVTEGHVERLPYSLKILLENLLRHADGEDVSAEDIAALANWDPHATPSHEIAFTPGRVIMQDFTGVPAVVDLAAMRDAVVKLGGDAEKINPLSPAELVIDHSVKIMPLSSSVTRNVTLFCAGVRMRLIIFVSYHRTQASSTRSTSNTWRALSSLTSRTTNGLPTRTRSSALIRILQ